MLYEHDAVASRTRQLIRRRLKDMIPYLGRTCWVRDNVHFRQYSIVHVLMRTFVGHFYLTKLLLPVLKAAAKGSPGTVRVVNMSSIAHYMSASEGIRWTTLGPGADAAVARKKLGVARLFGQSKLVKLHNSYASRWVAFVNLRKRAIFCFRMN